MTNHRRCITIFGRILSSDVTWWRLIHPTMLCQCHSNVSATVALFYRRRVVDVFVTWLSYAVIRPFMKSTPTIVGRRWAFTKTPSCRRMHHKTIRICTRLKRKGVKLRLFGAAKYPNVFKGTKNSTMALLALFVWYATKQQATDNADKCGIKSARVCHQPKWRRAMW